MEAKDGNFEIAPIESGALEAITRGEIDIQIATAHKYPRSITIFKERAYAMACLDQETAESCIYVRPVGKEKDEKTGKWEMKYAEGLSIRAAEIVGASYGNLRVGAMIIEQTPRKVTCRGYAHDLETNFAATSETVEVTVKANGEPYSERQAAVVAKACLSKALRDATFRVVPRAMFKSIELECRKMIAGDSKSFEQRKAAVVQWAQRLGIDVGRVWANLGIESPDDLTPEHLMTLTGLRTSIKDKEVSIDEAFPVVQEGKVGTTAPKTPAAPTTATEAAAEEKKQQATPAAQKPKPAPKPKPDPAPPQTAQEPAAEDPKPEKKAEEKPQPPPEPKAPRDPEALRKDILSKTKANNIGKNRLMMELREMKWVDSEMTWEAVPLEILERIETEHKDLVNRIMNPD